MPRKPRLSGQRWSIVLAGGEGERMRSFLTRRLGEHRPKQYCAFLGERTMLEHTLERALRWSGPDRVVTVIGPGHGRYLEEPRRLEPPGLVVEQPAARDTAPGLLLPLAYVSARDPEATVAVFPSDHFIAPGSAFQETLERAGALAEALEGRLVLLGAVPDRPEPEYGWIQPGRPLAEAPSAWTVAGFLEKPGIGAQALFSRGALWNTLILVFKARTLWEAAEEALSGLAQRFSVFRAAVGTVAERDMLQAAYAGLEPANVSRDILQRAIRREVVLPLEGVEWSDWGRPERIEESLLGRLGGAVPAFA